VERGEGGVERGEGSVERGKTSVFPSAREIRSRGGGTQGTHSMFFVLTCQLTKIDTGYVHVR
jgi:hypothetical protein